MPQLLREAFTYGLASVAALAADMSILAFLVQVCDFSYLAAASVSFFCGAFVAYILSIKLVFKWRRINDSRAEFVSFVALGAVGSVLNFGIMYIAVNYLALHYLAAKAVAAGFTFSCNFVMRRNLLFVPPEAALAKVKYE